MTLAVPARRTTTHPAGTLRHGPALTPCWITVPVAQILKIDDRVGSLDVGKDADILVMDREPLDYRSFVDLAYVNGRVAYDRSKVNLWNHIQTDRSKGLKKGWKPWGPWPELGELQPPTEAGGNGNGGN